MIVGIVGSRERNTKKDYKKLIQFLLNLVIDEKHLKMEDITIITGDCETGGDKFAREIADLFKCKLNIKYKIDPRDGERLEEYRIVSYYEFCKICYTRNEEIAKEEMDYLIALISPDTGGGTGNTIKHFKMYHKDWKEKLILI